tara:strand:+ start:4356 stop:4763 length:408 start_codon:yes stop_codon:yes gene_type:complete
MQKQIVLDISKELFFLKKIEKKNYFYISSNNEYKRFSKKNSKSNKIYFAIIDFKKFQLTEILNIFILLNRNFKIYKNILIFFELEKEIIAHNFFPDWPGHYKFINILGSSYFWFKKFLANLVFFKKIKFIVIKFK